VEHLKTLNQRNADVERDVLRMQAKQKIEDDIKLLKAQIPLVKYSESKAELNRLAELYNVEKEKVRKAKAEVAPIRDELRYFCS
jgi:chromosome segregation ATPase